MCLSVRPSACHDPVLYQNGLTYYLRQVNEVNWRRCRFHRIVRLSTPVTQCVRSKPVNQTVGNWMLIASKRLKLQTSNLTYTFPGLVQTWSLNFYGKLAWSWSRDRRNFWALNVFSSKRPLPSIPSPSRSQLTFAPSLFPSIPSPFPPSHSPFLPNPLPLPSSFPFYSFTVYLRSQYGLTVVVVGRTTRRMVFVANLVAFWTCSKYPTATVRSQYIWSVVSLRSHSSYYDRGTIPKCSSLSRCCYTAYLLSSVRHTGGSVKNGWCQNHAFFTVYSSLLVFAG